MKKLFIIYLLLFTNTAFAFNYSDEDKNIFYDAFIEGYMQKISETVNSLDMEQTKKDIIINEFAKQIDKTDLMNSSWDCIKKYPINDIVKASVECTQDWTAKQAKIHQQIFKKIEE